MQNVKKIAFMLQNHIFDFAITFYGYNLPNYVIENAVIIHKYHCAIYRIMPYYFGCNSILWAQLHLIPIYREKIASFLLFTL